MGFHNSNLVAFVNAKNLELTRKATEQQSATLNDIALTNRQMAQDMSDLLNTSEQIRDVGIYTAQLVSEGNQTLKEINSDLKDIGFSLRQIDFGIRNVESAIEKQTSIHQEHYDALKKEKVIKEVIYNMKKFQKECDEFEDPLAKAFGSNKLIELIRQTGFSTKHLSDIADKEYFDNVLLNSEKSWKSISDTERQSLKDLELIYFNYKNMLETDIEELALSQIPNMQTIKHSEPNLPPKPELILPSKPITLDKYPTLKKDADGFLLKVKKNLFKRKLTKNILIFSFISIFLFAIAGTFVTKEEIPLYRVKKEFSALNEKQTKEEILNETIGELKLAGESSKIISNSNLTNWKGKKIILYIDASGRKHWILETISEDLNYFTQINKTPYEEAFETIIAFSIAVFIFSIPIYIFLSISGLVGVDGLSKSKVMKILEEYKLAMDKYDRDLLDSKKVYEKNVQLWEEKVRALGDDSKKRIAEIELKNKNIHELNKNKEQERNDFKKKFYSILENTKEQINSFLNQHPKLEEYLPKV
jgi:hypothetical protein